MSVNALGEVAKGPVVRPDDSHTVPGLKMAGLVGLALAVLCTCVALLADPNINQISHIFFREQDIYVIAAAMMLFASAWFWMRWPVPAIPEIGRRELLLGGAALVLVGAAGHFFIMREFAFSRDEQMVLFDAEVFSGWQLVASIPDRWRAVLDAMNHTFLIVTPDKTGWVSAYLPVNAMIHSLVYDAGLGFLINPLLALIGLFATWRIAQDLWPDNSESVAVAVLLYLTSTQVWAMSMTGYAMTGHLALNMVWLMFFLRGGWRGHAAAMAVGFIACGLHQVVFHPLFVLPFIRLLLYRGEWKTVACYGVAYGLIGLFWVSYAKLAVASGAVAEGFQVSGISGYAERLWALIDETPPDRNSLMAANLMRFFAWQNLILLPLLIVAAGAVYRNRKPLYLAMFGALILTPIVMFLLIAFQGHGWGYRYMHGLIGVACLLGAWGWHQLREQGKAPLQAIWVPTVATVFLIAPFLLFQARDLIRNYAAADQLISKLDVDLVLIDASASPLAVDLAINRPSIENRPVRLVSQKVDAARLAALCKKYSIAEITDIGRLTTPKSRVVCKP